MYVVDGLDRAHLRFLFLSCIANRNDDNPVGLDLVNDNLVPFGQTLDAYVAPVGRSC